MKNTSRIIALTLLFGLTISTAFARPEGKKATTELQRNIQELIAHPEMKADLTGEAVIYFSLDEEGDINVKGVMGTNEALIEHIETSLRNQTLDVPVAVDQNFRVKVQFSDIR